MPCPQQGPISSQHVVNTDVKIFIQTISRETKYIHFDQLAKETTVSYIETTPIKFMLDLFNCFAPYGLSL